MAVKKHMMFVVVVTFLQDPRANSRSPRLKPMLQDLDGDMQMLVYE